MTPIKKISVTVVVAGVLIGFFVIPSGFASVLVAQVLLAVLLFVVYRLIMHFTGKTLTRYRSSSANVTLLATFFYIVCTVALTVVERNIVQIGIEADESGGDGTPGVTLVLAFFSLLFISASSLGLVFHGIRRSVNIR